MICKKVTHFSDEDFKTFAGKKKRMLNDTLSLPKSVCFLTYENLHYVTILKIKINYYMTIFPFLFSLVLVVHVPLAMASSFYFF